MNEIDELEQRVRTLERVLDELLTHLTNNAENSTAGSYYEDMKEQIK